ncbi:MAG TPA: RNA polymerase sigma factor [Longimicrobiales bacterium]|nr:RNA polymerase sigma factor [Longimicrobiales bacterium]
MPPPRQQADAESGIDTAQDTLLVERVLRGDAEAYGDLVRRHMRRAFAIAYRILEHREDAEDVVQDAFLRALERIDSLDTRRPFHPWLYRIVVNQALNYRRSRSRRAMDPMPATVAAAGPTPEEDAEAAALRRQLRSALDALPERQRTMVQLADLEGFNSTEIAGILDIAPGTVRWHLHAARRTLRKVLEAARGVT